MWINEYEVGRQKQFSKQKLVLQFSKQKLVLFPDPIAFDLIFFEPKKGGWDILGSHDSHEALIHENFHDIYLLVPLFC